MTKRYGGLAIPWLVKGEGGELGQGTQWLTKAHARQESGWQKSQPWQCL